MIFVDDSILNEFLKALNEFNVYSIILWIVTATYVWICSY